MTKKTEKILLFLLFLFCLALRLAFITQKNLWFDEVFSWNLTLGSFYEIIVRTSNDIHPPLFYFVLKLWDLAFGDSVFAMRLLSALFCSSAVFFIYPLAKRVLNSANSLIVVLLYCVSPLNLYYSQEVRMSAMNLFLNLGSVYFLFKLMDEERLNVLSSKLRGLLKDRVFYGYVLFTAAAIYTHYFSFFILAAQLLYIISVNKKNLKLYRPFLVIYSAIVMLYLLWLPPFFDHLMRGQSWRSPQTISQIGNEYINYLKDMNLGLYYHYSNLEIIRYITIFLAIAFIISITGLLWKKKENSNSSLPFIIMIVVIPLLIAGLISIKQKIEFYRYLSILVPYILILLVYGLTGFKLLHRYASYSLIFFTAIVNIYGVDIHFRSDFKNDDYRPLIKLINDNYTEGERIYAEPHYNGWVIDYYKKQENLRIPNTAFIRYGWNEIMDSINVQKPESFWVVFDYSSVDTTKYSKYKSDLSFRFENEMTKTFFLAPSKVELFRYSKKK